GFFFILATKPTSIGMIVSTTYLSPVVKRQLEFCDRIQHIKLDFVIEQPQIQATNAIEQVVQQKIITRDYQMDTYNKFLCMNPLIKYKLSEELKDTCTYYSYDGICGHYKFDKFLYIYDFIANNRDAE